MPRFWIHALSLGAVAAAASLAEAAPPQTGAVPLGRPAGQATTDVTGTVSATPAKYGRYVVVYFNNAQRVAGRGTSATIDQKDIAFVPRLTVVQPGANVTFVNSDPVIHNVFSPDPKQFNLGKMVPGSRASHVFNVVGKHTLLCNVHPGMIAYVFVSPSGYYATVDAHGRYNIPDVPDGRYRLTAWSPKLPARTRTVRLHGGTVRVDFHLHR